MSGVLETLISGADTSAASYARMQPASMSRLQSDIRAVVMELQSEGAADVSRREIQARYELKHGKRIESSSVASSVHAMVLAGRLVSVSKLRECRITGRDICPVFAPLQQARLVD